MRIRIVTIIVVALILIGCSGVPSGVTVIEGFDLNRYLGTWYEIARLDHSFERGLSHVTAQYTLREDGQIDVVNRGYDDAKGTWQSARAVAKAASSPSVASLKVSFFRPFWADYHIIALDKDNYQYAMVTSSTRGYLWILARTSTLDDAVLADLLAKAAAWGYDTEKLIFPNHQ
jgi:apolipoprotein D and lipocalin family protein